MNAEQMFEKLGYTKCNDCTNPSYFKKDDPYAWINFNNKRVAISSQLELGYESLDYELVKAIYKQCQELGWVDEKICTNFTDQTSCDFMCSNCGVYLGDLSEIVIPENCKGNVNQDEYELRYCPNCGCKIVDYDHFAKKAKYKVTQFEFDLLNTYRFCKEGCKFRDCTQLREMKEKGYYKDIDADAKIRDILWNCGVVKDENC